MPSSFLAILEISTLSVSWETHCETFNLVSVTFMVLLKGSHEETVEAASDQQVRLVGLG